MKIKKFGILVNICIYYSVCFAVTIFFIKIEIARITPSDFFFVLFPGLVLVWAVTYHGIWVDVAERCGKVFWKAFATFNILPGLLGAISAFGVNWWK